MILLGEIRNSKRKPKELLTYLAEKVKTDKNLLAEFPSSLQNGTPVEKGICMEVLEYISKDNPELIEPYIMVVISFLNDKAPRVKWEGARVLANLAQNNPEKVSLAVEKLFINTKDAGTVVRWSAAFALGEIAKYNTKIRTTLVPQIQDILKRETNNGVRNVYLKALKNI